MTTSDVADCRVPERQGSETLLPQNFSKTLPSLHQLFGAGSLLRTKFGIAETSQIKLLSDIEPHDQDHRHKTPM